MDIVREFKWNVEWIEANYLWDENGKGKVKNSKKSQTIERNRTGTKIMPIRHKTNEPQCTTEIILNFEHINSFSYMGYLRTHKICKSMLHNFLFQWIIFMLTEINHLSIIKFIFHSLWIPKLVVAGSKRRICNIHGKAPYRQSIQPISIFKIKTAIIKITCCSAVLRKVNDASRPHLHTALNLIIWSA